MSLQHPYSFLGIQIFHSILISFPLKSKHNRLVSSPISLHWLWTIDNPLYQTTTFTAQEAGTRTAFIEQKAKEMCHDW